jgi:hypothetical protein
MAEKKTPDGRMVYQRTPAQAHRVFGFDQDRFTGGETSLGAPRQKYLFLVRFVRGTGEGKKSAWEDGLSFACKRFDRPNVMFETQVLNQYNKKRIVQTGIKYNPVKIEFHDTADQKVMQMWHEYASFYFGDFRKSTAADWKYDIVNPDFKNAGKEGFGLTLPNEKPNDSPEGFFTALECYQFAGGTFTQFDLVNPKIISFNPDEMDYGSDVGHGLTMTIDYEAIIYKNDSKPVPMNSSSAPTFIQGLANDRFFNGSVHEPDGPINPSAQQRFGDVPGNPITGLQSNGTIVSATPWVTVGPGTQASNATTPSASSSALGSFGAFNFGNASALFSDAISQPGLIQSVVGGNFKGAKQQILGDIKQKALNNVLDSALNPKGVSGVSAALYDVARTSAQGIMNGNGSSSNATVQWAKSRIASSVIGTLTSSLKKDQGGNDWI